MGARIVIVEDEPLVALELRETLEDAGHVVVATLDSADQVLPTVRAEAPDLLLMDVRLRSFIDGVDAVQRLRILSKVPVIYLTAYSTPDVVHRADRTAPSAFLVKPVDAPVLLRAIHAALNPAGGS